MTAPLLTGAGAVFGLDLGTHLGWAIAQGDEVVRSGAIDLTPKRGDAEGARYLRLSRWLEREAWPLLPPGVAVVVEDVRSHGRRDAATGRVLQGVTAAHVYGGLRAIVAAWAAARGLPLAPIGVGTWKSGLGLPGSHTPKEAVLARVQLLGYRPETQDEADAIGIALHGIRQARLGGLLVGRRAA